MPKIHPTALVSSSASLADDVEVGPFAIIENEVVIGAGCKIASQAKIRKGVVMGEHNTLANNVMIAGHCKIGNRIFFGGGTAIHQFIHVGDFAMTQGNCGMTRDVPPYCIVHQINQLSGLKTVGLKRGGFSPEERKEIKAAFALLLNSKTTRAEALATADKIACGPAAAKLIEAVRHPSPKGILTR